MERELCDYKESVLTILLETLKLRKCFIVLNSLILLHLCLRFTPTAILFHVPPAQLVCPSSQVVHSGKQEASQTAYGRTRASVITHHKPLHTIRSVKINNRADKTIFLREMIMNCLRPCSSRKINRKRKKSLK